MPLGAKQSTHPRWADARQHDDLGRPERRDMLEQGRLLLGPFEQIDVRARGAVSVGSPTVANGRILPVEPLKTLPFACVLHRCRGSGGPG